MPTELAKAYVQIIPSAQGIKGSISSVLGDEASSAGGISGKLLGGKMLSVLKGIIATAGIGKALFSTISEGAALEQSIGGIETLFKDSADKITQYANEAYKTAGLSANDYMQTVTGFSASLLQGLGGDTAKAADISNMAITDMADNANKMGTGMESIQNAYQGFAKQNYTMLDNLKLGYGGTKTEMQRLLADAQKISGVKYDISNLSDVYSAIHVIQGELDITGTTAKEAASTIQGSLSAMKSSYKNVLGALALGQDIKPALSSLVSTSSTFLFGNLLPAVGNVFKAIPTVFTGIIYDAVPQFTAALLGFIPSIKSEIPNIINNFTDMANEVMVQFTWTIIDSLPKIISTGTEILTSLVSGIAINLPLIAANALECITGFIEGIIINLPQILASGQQILSSFIGGISSSLPNLIACAGEMIVTIVSALIANFPQILSGGFDLVISLIAGIGSALPDIISAMGNLTRQIGDTVKNVDWNSLGKNIVQGMIDGIGSMAGALWDAAANIAKSAYDAIKNVLGIHSPSTVMRDKVGKFIPMGLAEGISQNVGYVKSAMRSLSDNVSGRLSSRLSYNLGTAYGPAASGQGTVFYQTINTHDSLSPSEISRETEDFLSRARWKNP